MPNLRQLIPRRQIDLIPLLARKSNSRCLTRILHPLQIRRAENGLHVGRMTQQPRNCNRRVRHTFVRRDRVDRLIQFGEFGIIQKDAFKESILERRPRLNDNFFEAAVIQNTAIPINRAVNFHIHINSRINHPCIGDTELELIEMDILLDEFGQQLDLHRVLVAHAKILHLAAAFQNRERLRDLFRFHQRVGAMQQDHVKMIRSQPFQTAVHCIQNMLFGKIKTPCANPNLGLQDHLLAQAGVHVQGFGKFLFAFPACIHVGVVKKIDAFIQRGMDQRGDFLIRHTRDPHTTQRDLRRVRVCIGNFDVLHRNT